MPSLKNPKLLERAVQSFENKLPFVLYSHPNEGRLHGVFQNDQSLLKLTDFEDVGFVFAPFNENHDTVLISGEFSVEPMDGSNAEAESVNIEFFDQEAKLSHIQLVKKALVELQVGSLKKVVLSRCIKTDTSKAPEAIFEGLLNKYSNAFCYWWYHPKIGMWLGGTPEQLLHYKNGEIRTHSLAGTLAVEKDKTPHWSSKEREEQQMVTDYVVSSLQHKVKNLRVSSTSTHRAGKLWHLKTEITAEIDSFDELQAIATALHPTPAVCGLPKKDAMHFILKREPYNRAYYTGYLGPVNLEAEQHVDLFVNLRCFEYSAGKVTLYVGGGITSDSSAEREWEETQFKSRTILEVL